MVAIDADDSCVSGNKNKWLGVFMGVVMPDGKVLYRCLNNRNIR
jgi:hypothetical protein